MDAALASATTQGLEFDALLLNAGGMVSSSGGEMAKTDSGLSQLFALNVGGHVQLIAGLLGPLHK